MENLEGRQLLATLAPIPTVNSPATVGYQVPLQGGATGNQTFTVTSSNPDVKVSVANGKFWTVGVKHDSSGPNDPAFIGSLTFQLFGDLTPMTVSKIEQLISTGFYTSPTVPGTSGAPQLPSKNFHRIVSGFVAQGGSQTGNGTGSLNAPGYPFPDEFVQQLVFDGSGQLAMANAGDDTNDSQFFVTYGPTRNLDYNHTIFGQLVAGASTFAQMEKVATQANSSGENSVPVSPVLITSSTLSNTNPNGVLHVDTTGATAGETSNVTVTATDPSDGTKVTRTFQVNVTPNQTTAQDGTVQPVNEPAFLNPVPNLVVATGQPAIFQLTATNPEPTDTLTYVVNGGTSNGAFTQVQNATATVDSNGVVTVTPNANFTGVINLQVGVRDQADHGRSTNITDPANYDTQQITLTVRNGAVVNLQPIAAPGTATAIVNTASTIQLAGLTANPNSTTQTLNYELLQSPQHGTLTNFDAANGTFTYTPNPGYLGNDTVQYRVTDVGAPTPNLTSQPATFTINVTGANTGAVRVIDRVLIVTPPPRTDHGTNTIRVETTNSGANYQILVNGQVDTNMPAVTAIDRLVIYGAKASDQISVGSDVTIPALLSGGQGGVNLLQAGGGPSRLHGWFGRNTLVGGPQADALIGRTGHVRFRPSAGKDLIFAGQANPGRRYGVISLPTFRFSSQPKPPTGTFYRYVGNRLVAIQTPPLLVRATDHPLIGANHVPRTPNTTTAGQAATAAAQEPGTRPPPRKSQQPISDHQTGERRMPFARSDR